MAKAYSSGLRERIVKAVAEEGLSPRQAAQRFGVGASTVVKWMQRLRDGAGVAPGQMGGHRPKKIIGAWQRLAAAALPGP